MKWDWLCKLAARLFQEMDAYLQYSLAAWHISSEPFSTSWFGLLACLAVPSDPDAKNRCSARTVLSILTLLTSASNNWEVSKSVCETYQVLRGQPCNLVLHRCLNFCFRCHCQVLRKERYWQTELDKCTPDKTTEDKWCSEIAQQQKDEAGNRGCMNHQQQGAGHLDNRARVDLAKLVQKITWC